MHLPIFQIILQHYIITYRKKQHLFYYEKGRTKSAPIISITFQKAHPQHLHKSHDRSVNDILEHDRFP